MSIGAIGAGVSALFNIIHQVTTPQAPATPAAPAAAASTTPYFQPGIQWQLKQKIQTAVTAALQDPSNAATAPNQVIQQAIASVLQGNNPATPATPLDPQTQKTQFAALLQSKGVDPSQFQADFDSALQQSTVASGGTLDYTKIFKTAAPTGTTLNTLA